jgi:hypothetical protein
MLDREVLTPWQYRTLVAKAVKIEKAPSSLFRDVAVIEKLIKRGDVHARQKVSM